MDKADKDILKWLSRLGINEATGDRKFDDMMSKITSQTNATDDDDFDSKLNSLSADKSSVPHISADSTLDDLLYFESDEGYRKRMEHFLRTHPANVSCSSDQFYDLLHAAEEAAGAALSGGASDDSQYEMFYPISINWAAVAESDPVAWFNEEEDIGYVKLKYLKYFTPYLIRR